MKHETGFIWNQHHWYEVSEFLRKQSGLGLCRKKHKPADRHKVMQNSSKSLYIDLDFKVTRSNAQSLMQLKAVWSDLLKDHVNFETCIFHTEAK